jgi:hypothetical protein
VFGYNTMFTDISMPALHENLDFTFDAQNMASEMNLPLELRVIDAATMQLVGRYVLGRVPGATMRLALPGIVKSGRGYDIEFFVDENGNGAFDPPPTDHAWRLTQQATSSGLTVHFTHNTMYQNLDW